MLLVDTNVWLAAADRRSRDHARCRAVLDEHRTELASTVLIGRAGLHQPERVDWPGLEVGWTLHPDAWGHGYATEAGRAAIDYAFEVLDRDEVVSIIAATNTRSQAVATRLGLRWVEERTMAWNPGGPLGIWRLAR